MPDGDRRLFSVMSCVSCFVEFGVPAGFEAKRREDCKSFYCPNGHSMVYAKGETEADKLRRERDRLKQQIAEREDAIARERRWREQEGEKRMAAERRASAARGQVTKMKKRAAAGTCPCCRRNFSNMADHMRTEHPGFLAEPVEGEETTV